MLDSGSGTYVPLAPDTTVVCTCDGSVGRLPCTAVASRKARRHATSTPPCTSSMPHPTPPGTVGAAHPPPSRTAMSTARRSRRRAVGGCVAKTAAIMPCKAALVTLMQLRRCSALPCTADRAVENSSTSPPGVTPGNNQSHATELHMSRCGATCVRGTRTRRQVSSSRTASSTAWGAVDGAHGSMGCDSGTSFGMTWQGGARAPSPSVAAASQSPHSRTVALFAALSG